MKRIYSSIDIGSDTIKVVVCELYKNKLNLLAASSVKSKGIKKGLITDFEQAERSIKQAFVEIEEMLGIQIKKVIASIPSYQVEFTMVTGEVNIEQYIDEDIMDAEPMDGTITGEDITRVLQVAMESKEKTNQEIVTILPIDFKVDDKKVVKDPKGLTAKTLSARGILLTTPKKNMYSVVGLLDRIGIEVVDVSINPIGDSFAFKDKKMDESVGAIINIGSEVTSVSLYNKGIIVKNHLIGLGGRNIDNDISYMYRLDHSTAVHLKEKCALAHKLHANTSEIYEVTNTYGETIKINQYELSEVVMSRLEEILSLAKKEIQSLTNRHLDYTIITGGVSNMTNFGYIADDVFGRGTTVGNVKLVGIRNNRYASAVGNIVYFVNKLKLKGQSYTMVSREDQEELSTISRNLINVSNESMLGKVFGYFFSE